MKFDALPEIEKMNHGDFYKMILEARKVLVESKNGLENEQTKKSESDNLEEIEGSKLMEVENP